MNEALLKKRKEMFASKMQDPKYLETSYERQARRRKANYVDERKRVQ